MSSKAPETALAEKLVAEVLAQGYLMARVLPDGSVAAVQRMLTTTAVFVGLTPWGYEGRYCFKSGALAALRYEQLQSEDDVPAGWIARRPARPEDIEAKQLPGYLGGDPALPSSWEKEA